jgi:protein SCO1/2
MKTMAFVAPLLLGSLTIGPPDPGKPVILKDAGIRQNLNAQVPLDLHFRDESGRSVTFGECCAGKTTVLVMAYYRCPMLCTQVLNGVVDCLRGVPFNAGKEFEVVVVSFDPREQPALARAKKAAYVEAYGRPGAEEGWHFLTGEREQIDELCRAVGFGYQYDVKRDQFAHASGIMILTPGGRVSRYLLGIGGTTAGSPYGPRDLRLALVEASEEKIGSPWDGVLLFCYVYDPEKGNYRFAINAVRTAGAVTVLLLGGALGLAWWREWRKRGKGLTTEAQRAQRRTTTERKEA